MLNKKTKNKLEDIIMDCKNTVRIDDIDDEAEELHKDNQKMLKEINETLSSF